MSDSTSVTTADIGAVEAWLMQLQDAICAALAALEDGAGFREDSWERPDGGGGRTRVLAGGATFEQAGVNFSHVTGDALPPAATARRPDLAGRGFRAMGVSLVVHPLNPTSRRRTPSPPARLSPQAPVWRSGGLI